MSNKAIVAAFCAVSWIMGVGGAQAQQPTVDSSAVETAFRTWESSFVSRDAATLSRIAAPEFVQVEDGDVDRATAIGMPTRSPDYRIEEVKIESVSAVTNGDSAQLTGVIVVRENFSGRRYTTRKSVSEVWAKRGGAWLLTREELKELK